MKITRFTDIFASGFYIQTLTSRLYDREGNGYITTSTLKEILAALDDKLSNSDLESIIAEIDTDGSGTVDFDGKLLFLT